MGLSVTRNEIVKKMRPVKGKYFQNGPVRIFHSCHLSLSIKISPIPAIMCRVKIPISVDNNTETENAKYTHSNAIGFILFN
jgi:hypothetical protein